MDDGWQMVVDNLFTKNGASMYKKQNKNKQQLLKPYTHLSSVIFQLSSAIC